MGVNKYTLDHEEAVEVLSIDNAKTIEIQVRIEDSLHMHTFTYNCIISTGVLIVGLWIEDAGFALVYWYKSSFILTV